MNEEAVPLDQDRCPVPSLPKEFPREIPAPEVAPQPCRRWKPGIGVIKATAIIIAALLVAYWRWTNVLWIINELLLPYTGAIAFLSLGLIGLRFKDWKRYEHPYAPRAALGIVFLCGTLMAVNSYRERRGRQKEREDNTANFAITNGNIEGLRTTLTARADGTEKNLGELTAEVHDFKEKVKPDEIRTEMNGLRSTLDKVINPPKAELLFTFTPLVNPPLDGKNFVPIREVTLPLNADGSVHVSFALVNNTGIPTKETELAAEICTGCKFAKEPEGFIRPGAYLDRSRNYVYGNMPAAGAFKDLFLDIIPPPNAPSFEIRVTSRCDNCVLERLGPVGVIHIQRN